MDPAGTPGPGCSRLGDGFEYRGGQCQQNSDRLQRVRRPRKNKPLKRANKSKPSSNSSARKSNLSRKKSKSLSSPASAEYLERLQEWINKRALYQAYSDGQKQVLEAEHQAWAETLYTKLLEEVEKIAQAEGVDLILNKDQSPLNTRKLSDLLEVIRGRKVLYSTAELDLTDKVLDSLNQRYAAEK